MFAMWALQESKILKFLGFMWNPLSWVMEAAAIMAIALANGGVRFFLVVFFHKLSSLKFKERNSQNVYSE